MLHSQCQLTVNDAEFVAARLCASYAEFAPSSMSGNEGSIVLSFGEARLSVLPGRLDIDVFSPDATGLAYVKMGLVHRIRDEMGLNDAAIRWIGDGATGLPPFFREMRVVETFDITPGMRRVVLAGEDLARFATGGLHVRLVFPPEGRAPVWPQMGEDGCPVWPDGEDALTLRLYTIREIDLEAGRVAIDILRHDGDATPGSRFAASARAGDRLGMVGPSGSGVPAAHSFLLLGDETALPAIARILETLPAEAEAEVFVEVANAGERQPLPSAARARVTWLHRDDAAGTGQLARIVENRAEPSSADLYVWAGCEFTDFRAIRRHVRGTWKLPKERHSVTAYWRKGVAGDEARKGE